MSHISRRRFLQSTAAGSSMLLLGTRASGNIQGANDRLRIAVCGLNGRGQSHIKGWMDQDLDETQKITEIRYMSEKYFKLIERDPEIGKILALGARVTFVFEGKAYRIVE